MLLRNVFTKTLRDLRWPTFWTGLSLFAIAGYFTLLYPTYSKTFDLESLLAKIPPAMRAMIGGQFIDVSSATGFLNIELFPLILPAVLAGYAIAQGSGLTAAEESRGTIDVLLSYPVPRWRLVVEKSAAIVISVALVASGLWLGAVAGAAGSNSPLEASNVAAGPRPRGPARARFRRHRARGRLVQRQPQCRDRHRRRRARGHVLRERPRADHREPRLDQEALALLLVSREQPHPQRPRDRRRRGPRGRGGRRSVWCRSSCSSGATSPPEGGARRAIRPGQPNRMSRRAFPA